MILPLLAAAAMSAAAQAPPAQAPLMPPPQAGGYAVNIATVFVRRTPTLPGPVIDEVPIHTLFKVISCQNGWCALNLGKRAGVGYLTANVLKAVPPPSTPYAGAPS